MTSRPRVVRTATAVSTPPADPDLEGDISARAVRAVVDESDDVGRGRVDRVDADPGRDRAPERVGFDEQHPRSAAQGDGRDQHPHRPAADHDDLFVFDEAGPPDVVDRDRDRLDERRPVQCQPVGEWEHQVRRNGPRRLHRSG
jgi:hypothetical protein